MKRLVTYKHILFSFLMGVTSLTWGQTYTIPDANFRSCLVNDYPSLMDGSNELIISQANAFTGTLECKGEGIVNVDGLQHFTSVSELDFSNNDIVDFTATAGLIQLTAINLNSNELEFVPDLSGFSSLTTFRANYNQLDNPPIFPSSITKIYMGNNSLAGTIDVSNLTNLDTLSIFENDIQELQGFENLTQLKALIAYTNELKQPKDLTSLTQLAILQLSHNEYKDLPTFSLGSLQQVEIDNNMLTFEDFMPFVDLSIFPAAFPDFSTQAAPETAQTDVVEERYPWSWTLSFDEELNTNTYTWYKDNSLIATTTMGTYGISPVSFADDGVYRCEVINSHPKLAGITIITNNRTLDVIAGPPCFTVDNIATSQDTPSCEEVSNVSIQATTSGVIIGELQYILSSTSTTQVSQSGNFELTQEGTYTLDLMDEGGCTVSTTEEVYVIFDLNDCDPPAFSPNGDGLDDQYYINSTGRALIYNKKGQMVKELQVPAYWDGTNQENTLLDYGLYVIIINGQEKKSVTLLR